MIKNAEGICEQTEPTFSARLNSIGVLTGRHTEAMEIQDLLVRGSGCSALYFQDAYDWEGNKGVKDCPGDAVHPWPTFGGFPIPTLACSADLNSDWYSPWCPTASGVDTSNLESAACNVLQEINACEYTPDDFDLFSNQTNGAPDLTDPFVCTL
ncbi:MAG: hypothetical protein ACPHRO_03255 [Nannocystaceae bacterium]